MSDRNLDVPSSEISQTAAHEEMLDEIIDKVLVLSENPEKDDALIKRLQYDLATKIHSPAEIARRYGLFDVQELRDYLLSHPQIVDGVKKIRALFESEEGIETRMRAKFQYSTEDLIPVMHSLVGNPGIPVQQRIDGFKQLQRGAGMDGIRDKNSEGPSGQRFVLNILFGGDAKNTTIAGTVPEDPASIPAPPSGMEEDHQEDPVEEEV